MRGFLIFLAVASPVVLASPYFWSLVRMEWGGQLNWTDGAMPFPFGAKDQPCWAG